MKRIDWNALGDEERAAVLRRPTQTVSDTLREGVRAIFEAVAARGEDALRVCTDRFDGVRLEAFEVDAEELEAAARQVPADKLATWDRPLQLGAKSAERQELLSWAARYLGKELQDGKPLDPVARFHLGNGARIERLNWAGDPSPKGLKQSYGLMVNYLYDLKRLDKHRAMFSQGQIPISGAIEDLYL